MRKTDFLPKGMKGHDVISFSWHLLEIGFGSSGQTDSYTWYLIDTFFRVWYFKGIYMAQKYLLIADSLKRTIDISPHEKCLAQKILFICFVHHINNLVPMWLIFEIV